MVKFFKKLNFITMMSSFAAFTTLAGPVFAAPENENTFRAKISAIPAEYKKLMQEYSWHQGCPTSLDDLAYLTLSYWGFDNKTHTGILIVNKRLAPEVVNIFHELYNERFPIERMELMETFKGNENAAMAANNTWAYNCQPQNGDANNFSLHSYGYAININTLINPFVKGSQVLPPSGKGYLNRSKPVPGMIIAGDKIYQLFTKHGWTWNGAGNNQQNYRQFEKDCNTPGICKLSKSDHIVKTADS